MSEGATTDFEALLRRALAPVDPPDELAGRVEETLTSITEMAADELEAWEIGAMRDPRNWVRPAAAVLAGTGRWGARRAAHEAALQAAPRRDNVLELAERTVHDAMHEARRLWR